MHRPVLLATALLATAPLVLAGCDSGSGAATADGGTGDTTAAAAGGDAAVDAADTASDAAEEPDAEADADAPDAQPDLPPRTCGVLTAQDETATYDVFSPLAQFVGDAQVTRNGLDVSVVINDPSEVNPVTFDGAFEAGSRCVAAEYQGTSADLCFFNPDGSPAQPETLGAFLFAYFAGTPSDRPNATLLGAIRRDVDLSCTPAGFFDLEVPPLMVTGQLTESMANQIRDAVLGYLAVFETGGGRADIVLGAPPVAEPIDTFDIDGSIETLVPLGLVIDVDGNATDFDVDVSLYGTVDLDTGALTLNVGMDASGGDPQVSGRLAGTVTGQRH
jgi:hypothetical protein